MGTFQKITFVILITGACGSEAFAAALREPSPAYLENRPDRSVLVTTRDYSVGETQFQFVRASTAYGVYSGVRQVASRSSSGTGAVVSFLDTQRIRGRQYCYKVRAVSPKAVSPFSLPVCLVAGPPQTPPEVAGNQPPVSRPVVQPRAVTGLLLEFSGSRSSDSDGRIVSYEWNFGDGSSAGGEKTSHSYSTPGVYEVELVVTDDSGASNLARARVEISVPSARNQPPVAVLDVPVTLTFGQAMPMSAVRSYDPDGRIVAVYWNFGDDTEAQGLEVQHTYWRLWRYTVWLTVVDDSGARHTIGQNVFIAPAPDQPVDPRWPPGLRFDMTRWELTLPTGGARDGGPLVVPPGVLFGSRFDSYFFTHPQTGAIVFKMDSSTQAVPPQYGLPKNELRELIDGMEHSVNWGISGSHELDAELALAFTEVERVVVLQIDGWGSTGPLLRLSMNGRRDAAGKLIAEGNLVAELAADVEGSTHERLLLMRGIRANRFRCQARIRDGVLSVLVNGTEALRRDVSAWRHPSFFRLGLAPQARWGRTELHVDRLKVSHE